MRISFVLAILAFASPVAASPSMTVTSRIWSQVVAFTLPSGFVTSYENTNGDHYQREAVPHGESGERWTQMITVTGDRNAASPDTTPKQFAQAIAEGFKRACPDTFAAAGIGGGRTSGYPSYEAVLSCGNVQATGGKSGEMTSETAAVLVIVGKRDVYTLQWAVRTAPSEKPMGLDVSKWKARLDRLKPVDVVNPV